MAFQKKVSTLVFLIVTTLFLTNCNKAEKTPTSNTPPEKESITVFIKSATNTGENVVDIYKKDSVMDYLIQDVCLDSKGNLTSEDPYSCKTKRNIQVGERLPYVRADFGKRGFLGNQATSSIPIKAFDGSTEIIHLKDIGSKQFLLGNFDYQPRKGDSFDLMETKGEFISIIRTMSPTCFDQILYGNNFNQNDAWILFDKNILTNKPRSVTSTLYTKRLEADSPCEKLIKSPSVLTNWSFRESLSFQSSKKMSALDSLHFAHSDLTLKDNSLVRSIYTKEYGLTRWESWTTEKRCLEIFKSQFDYRCNPESPTHILAGRCDSMPRKAIWGNQTWVMVDCRDSTNHRGLAKAYYPFKRDMVPFPVYRNIKIYKYSDLKTIRGFKDDSNQQPKGYARSPEKNKKPGIFVYGPYDSGLTGGKYRADFSLLIDSVEGDGDDTVATIDVTMDSGKKVLGTKVLTRSMFKEAFKYQDMGVDFALPNNAKKIEYRINWHGKTYLRFLEIKLMKSN